MNAFESLLVGHASLFSDPLEFRLDFDVRDTGSLCTLQVPLDTIAETSDLNVLTEYDGQRELFEHRKEIYNIL